MQIHQNLVNNELLSTIIFGFLFCYFIHIFLKTIANFVVDLIEYIYNKKKKTS